MSDLCRLIWYALIGLFRAADQPLPHAVERLQISLLGSLGCDELIYRRTGNLRAVQLLLGHTKIESTVRYLGIEVDDALAIAEQVDV